MSLYLSLSLHLYTSISLSIPVALPLLLLLLLLVGFASRLVFVSSLCLAASAPSYAAHPHDGSRITLIIVSYIFILGLGYPGLRSHTTTPSTVHPLSLPFPSISISISISYTMSPNPSPPDYAALATGFAKFPREPGFQILAMLIARCVLAFLGSF